MCPLKVSIFKEVWCIFVEGKKRGRKSWKCWGKKGEESKRAGRKDAEVREPECACIFVMLRSAQFTEVKKSPVCHLIPYNLEWAGKTSLRPGSQESKTYVISYTVTSVMLLEFFIKSYHAMNVINSSCWYKIVTYPTLQLLSTTVS